LRLCVGMSTQMQSKRSVRTSMSIGQELRTVGQGLESLEVQDFDLRSEADGYFALAIPRSEHESADGIHHIRNTWWNLTRRRSTDRLLSEAGPNVLRVLFTPEGLLRLEAAGIAKRDTHSSGTPDLSKLAQILRMIGERVDDKAARLLKVSKRGSWISFEYGSGADERLTEEWKLSDLRGLWRDASKGRLSATASKNAGPQNARASLFRW
jgi:hypothetical protein